MMAFVCVNFRFQTLRCLCGCCSWIIKWTSAGARLLWILTLPPSKSACPQHSLFPWKRALLPLSPGLCFNLLKSFSCMELLMLWYTIVWSDKLICFLSFFFLSSFPSFSLISIHWVCRKKIYPIIQHCSNNLIFSSCIRLESLDGRAVTQKWG